MPHTSPTSLIISNRRKFLVTSTLALSSPFVSKLSWAEGSPMQKLQYAAIGAGGRGAFDIGSMTRHKQIQMVAAADVDSSVRESVKGKHSGLETFADWRQMFSKMGKDIDVVTVSTPDHMHGIQAISAMNLGKHVYVQKPLAQNIGECRAMQEAAHRNKVVVQMGTQGASSFYDRMATGLVRAKWIGQVSEAWVMCGKTWGDNQPRPSGKDPVPEGLDWDGWLGVGPDRPYLKKYYHPKTWRRRQDFGSGTLGDMGCHIFNSMFRGLGLQAPRKVRSSTRVPNPDNWTGSERVEYIFPGNEYTEGELKVTWVSGKHRPPKELTDPIPEDTKYRYGCLLKGSEGTLLLRHGSPPMLLPVEKFTGVRPEKLPALGHHQAFVDAAISGKQDQLMSPIDYATALTETVLLGNVAMQYSPGWLEWDNELGKVTNNKEANHSIHREYREGWEIMEA